MHRKIVIVPVDSFIWQPFQWHGSAGTRIGGYYQFAVGSLPGPGVSRLKDPQSGPLYLLLSPGTLSGGAGGWLSSDEMTQ